ncbi:MAG TPA: hypothetical protein DDZ80_21080 [Cyanobacteria bacterium UBA8803]|nr:hypothetical protein [Cyanobacteria bacterium UBA8803]
MGGIIGIAVIVAPGVDDAKWAAGFGLAGTAISGAAGLAQSTKTESNVSVHKDEKNIQADVISSSQPNPTK